MTTHSPDVAHSITVRASAHPWRHGQLVRVTAGAGFAMSALVTAYWGTAQQARVGSQLPWLVAGVASVIWVVLRCATFLAEGYGALAVRRADLRDLLRLEAPTASATTPSNVPGTLLVLPGRTYYHRHDCAFVKDKDAVPFDPSRASSEAPRPCPACQP